MSNTIYMTRGDDKSFMVYRILKDGTHIPFEEGDTVRFTLRYENRPKKNKDDQNYIFQKVITDFDVGYAIVKLAPKDTENLDWARKYRYDCELTNKDGLIETFIEWTMFKLGKEAT